MSFIHNSALAGASGQGGVYEIEQSLRFDDNGSTYLNRTPSSAGNQQTWTFSAWLKRGSFTANQGIFNPVYGGDGSNESQIRWKSDNTLQIYDSGGARLNFVTTQVFRDPSAWYHLVIAVDTTQATEANRFKLYINGEQITAFGTSTYPTQNQTLGWNGTSRHDIGRYAQGGNLYYGGYMAEIHHVDGTQLDPTSFGEYADNGVWRPINVSGLTYGTNGFYLNFSNSSDLGEDQAGSNDWTANNFTTSGTGTDVMSDTPTTNYPTWNALERGDDPATSMGVDLSEGNLVAAMNRDVADAAWVANFTVPSSGKWYWEVEQLTAGSPNPFISTGIIAYPWTWNSSDHVRYDSRGRIGKDWNDVTYQSVSAWGAGYGSSSDVCGVAVNADNNTVQFYKNGVAQGTTESYSGSTYTYVPHCTTAANTAQNVRYNFGQRAFAYTPPTGFKALNTSNLPAPDIADGSKYFNTVLYHGNSTNNHAITGVGFSPDLVWIKPRDNADHHRLNTTTQGANRTLSSNLQSAEYGPVNAYLDSFDADGFTVSGSDNGWNNSSHDYVAWNWKEGAVPGFEIVTYTGNGYPTSNTQNVSHNLGVAPSFITIKNRDRSSQWLHYVKPLGATKGMEGWHDGDTAYTNSNYFANTEPTDTQFTVGSDSGGNWQGDDFIAYLWAEVDGFFKVGTYERNGSTDGPFIYLGFTPALIIIKEYAAGTEGWPIYDNKRLGYNPNDTPMFINATTTETYIQSTYPNEIDFLSNGFKIRNNDSRQNSTLSSYRYLYWAWAVNPFGGSGVSPATAR